MNALVTVMAARRSSVEGRLRVQADFLRRIVDLIEASTSFQDWPAEELSVLQGAMNDHALSASEARKARDLAWHLFRGTPPDLPPAVEDEGLRDVEERVRADLPGLVRLGAGRRLSGGVAPRGGGRRPAS